MKVISIVILAILTLGLLGFFGWLGFSAYQQSKEITMESTPETLFVTKNPEETTHPTTHISPTTIRPVTATSAVTPSIQVTETIPDQPDGCGETDSWNVLILGSDFEDKQGLKGAELTRMLRADFANQNVIVYTFSRDLWVDTSGLDLANPNIYATRLSLVFDEGRLRSQQLAELDTIMDGTRATAKMLSMNFSLKTDHFLVFDLAHLADMIDAIGGLPINIPTSITDPWIGMAIQAGQQTLNGPQVVAYARAIPDSEFDRIQRNNLILEAIHQKLLIPAAVASIPELYIKFQKEIATDLSLDQVNNLVCLLNDIPASSLLQESIKPEWTSPGPQGSMVWSKNNVLARLKQLGLIP